MAETVVRAVVGKPWQLQVDLVDELGQPAVSDDVACTMTARLNEGDDANLVVLHSNVLQSSALFAATDVQMTVAPGRYLADVAIDGAIPASTEKFYLDIESPVT